MRADLARLRDLVHRGLFVTAADLAGDDPFAAGYVSEHALRVGALLPPFVLSWRIDGSNGIGDGVEHGHGHGYGTGFGFGFGDGYGEGDGFGFGYGNGNGNGKGNCEENEND